MRLRIRLLRWALLAFVVLALLGALTFGGLFLYFERDLPDVYTLKEVQYEVPLRVYSREGQLMADYGEKRRIPLAISAVPTLVQEAFIAAEDDDFRNHHGISVLGLVRATMKNALSNERRQGASTITMQVARNFFLTSEKTYKRKLREIFLAFKIERELSKEEILELYLNKIYFGNRAYGLGAAAQVYYGVRVDELTLAQIAMLAGLPKAPSTNNPISNPERAKERRDWVLDRLLTVGQIDEATLAAAKAAPMTASLHSPQVEVAAPYVGEMVRAEMVRRYGERATMDGYKVYTTIRADMQRAASHALRQGLIDYDIRHGYRGAEANVDLKALTDELAWDGALGEQMSSVGGLRIALVLSVQARSAKVYLGQGRYGQIPWEGMVWAKKYISENYMGNEPQKASQVLKPGDIIRVAAYVPEPQEKGKEASKDSEKDAQDEAEPAEDLEALALRQIPAVSGALVSMDPNTGELNALVGGFDFYLSKFNRAVQAERQPGSNFKPFIYSAALEKDFTPASIINDAPVVFEDSALEDIWRPENSSGKFYGPTRLRVALTKSRNLVSIRLLRAIGVPYAHRYVERFGFDTSRLPRNLSLALGSGTVTPMELAGGYAVFANGGYRVASVFLDRIESEDGTLLYKAGHTLACTAPCAGKLVGADTDDDETAPLPDEAQDTSTEETLAEEGAPEQAATEEPASESVQGAEPAQGEVASSAPAAVQIEADLPAKRVISRENAYQIVSMMQSVVQEGTARRVLALGRNDLSGKTGTTNDQNDAWFSGYNADIVTTVWVGFDKLQPLGAREAGAFAALPIWVDFMRVALEGKPEHAMRQPRSMVTVKIDPVTGLLASANNPDAIFETFRADQVPTRVAFDAASESSGPAQGQTEIPEQLF